MIIGRERELDYLRQALGQARASQGSAVCVVGEPGIGKTRLTNELAERALGSGMRVVRGRGNTIGPVVPFRPLSEALLAVARSGVTPDFGDVSPYSSVLGRLVPEWLSGPDEPGGPSLVVLAEAVLRLVSALGQTGGCLMIVDDLQDCDAETLAVLEYLADNVRQQPVLLLMAVRPDPGKSLDLVEGAVQRGTATTVQLHRLDRGEVARLVSLCLGEDREALPGPLLDQIWDSSVGVPFVVEELLHGMVSSGHLTHDPDGWRLKHQAPVTMPMTLTRSIVERAERLGPQGLTVLAAAAVFGRRFPVDVVRWVTEMNESVLLDHLAAGVAAQLMSIDDTEPSWYSFQHPLITDALLSRLAPGHRAHLSGRAAEAVRILHPGLPGEWCQRAAVLSMAAGDDADAAEHFAEAGRRAFVSGAMDSAAVLLEHAVRLLPAPIESAVHAEVVESLLYALVEAGQPDRALQLMNSLDTGLDSARQAALHVRVAWATCIAGQPDRAAEQIAVARTLLGAQPANGHAAAVDMVAAYVALGTPGADSMRRGELLARRAVEAADKASLPDIACQAWQAIGMAVRSRDLLETKTCLERARRLAEQHRLPPIAQLSAMGCIVREDWLLDGDTHGIEQVRSDGLRAGLILLALNTDWWLGLDAVLRGQFATAAERLDRCRGTATRLKLTRVVHHTNMTSAVLAAHQARRGDMEEELAEFERAGGKMSDGNSPAADMIRALCSLLEEDQHAATVDLHRIQRWEMETLPQYHFISNYGLHLLVAVLGGWAGRQEYRAAKDATSSHMRWNRQFILLTEAVLAGRDGRSKDALSAFTQAQAAAAPYAMARHLGLRLVAPAAMVDGWGDPVHWLRQAEEYFHQRGTSAVARACRDLLRQAGASVLQRRGGANLVPSPLRALGITVREYETLHLLMDGLSNKAIAGHLHISSRTVEKHIANLIVKTGQHNRHAVIKYASDLHR